MEQAGKGSANNKQANNQRKAVAAWRGELGRNTAFAC